MTTTIGSLDLNAFSGLYSDSTQYFWFESNSSATYGAGVHITLSPDTSFISNPTGQNILMNTDGISIRNGLLPMMVLDNDSLDFNTVNTTAGTYTNVASFGAISTIGVSDGTQSYMKLDYHSIQMIDKEGNDYVSFADLRGVNGTLEWTDSFVADHLRYTYYSTTLSVSSNLRVYVDNVLQTYGTDYTTGDASDGTVKVWFSTSPIDGASINLIYVTGSQRAKAYTLGIRNPIYINKRAPLSVAVGDRVAANGLASFAEGQVTLASGLASHAEGVGTKASDYASHAEGQGTNAIAMSAHAEGQGTNANAPRAHSEGYNTTASGNNSHAEGSGAQASGSNSHAEGSGAQAGATSSHAEGTGTQASGDSSHAEGYGTKASGYCAHAEGGVTKADGDYGHAQNYRTVATEANQTVIGKYNSCTRSGSGTSEDPYIYSNAGDYAFIIGNGTGDSTAERSNALTVDWNGNITVNNHSSSIGTMLSYTSDNISCATGRYYQLAYLTLDAGVWMIDYVGQFPNTNTTGIRDTFVTTDTSGYNNVTTSPSAYGVVTRDRRTAAAHIIYCKASFPVNITSTTTFRLIGYQNSGQTNSVLGRMYAVRIK